MTIEEQAKEIVSKMTLKEKASLVYGNGTWRIPGNLKRGVESVVVHDGPCGLRKVPEDKGDDLSPAEPATCFPAPCLLACSWDPEVEARVGQAVAYECMANSTDVVLAPGVNIKRDPLCGRNFEYLSEDPLLAGKMAAGFINGCQNQGVGVSLKHFALNNQEAHRFTYSALCDMRAMREIYLKPFEIAVKESQPWTVMCAYNKIRGVYCSDNKWLLTDVLRKEWGFNGIVMSDWGATNNSVYSHASGLDLEMPCYAKYARPIMRAVRKGKLSGATITAEAERIVALSLKCQNKLRSPSAWNPGMSFEVAKDAAEKSIVLLKNDEGMLPLKPNEDYCVIGAMAKTPRYQGAGSSQVNPNKLVDFLSMVNAGRSSGNEIPFATGYLLNENDGDSSAAKIEAVDLAHSHKKVLLFLGLPADYEAEGFDRPNMLMPPNQLDLFAALYKINPNIIVVLSTGAPVELPFVKDCKALLLGYLAGGATGLALYDIVFGLANPSGKLAESWPVHYNDCPSKNFFPLLGDLALYKESLFVGYRYYLTAKREVLFPFGFGLSYTKFAYSDLKVTGSPLNGKGTLSVSFKVTNVGNIEGSEVVELYVRPTATKILKPLRELRFFDKVSLKPGKAATIRASLSLTDFSYYDELSERYEADEGDYFVDVGPSCEDIPLSAPVTIKSSFKGLDRRPQLPNYYNLPEHGVLFLGDEEFERLLGFPIPPLSPSKKRAFTLVSTIRDISVTWIGKKVVGFVKSGIDKRAETPHQAEQLYETALDSPIRAVTMMGIPLKIGMALVDMANHRPLKALYDVCFWHYR